jgi:4-carboxymuconolactone decarboxylase
MPRIKSLTTKEDVLPEQSAEIDAIVATLGRVGGPFGILLHSPGLAQKVMEAGAHVRLQTSLTMVERELALLSTLREKDAAYEWSGHVETARKAGMREEAIEAMRYRHSDLSKLTDDERDIITYTRQLLRTNAVDEALQKAMIGRHSTRWMVEITATIGQYQYISAINCAFAVEPPADRADKLPVPDPSVK